VAASTLHKTNAVTVATLFRELKNRYNSGKVILNGEGNLGLNESLRNIA
jgi:hypothetical protein